MSEIRIVIDPDKVSAEVLEKVKELIRLLGKEGKRE